MKDALKRLGMALLEGLEENIASKKTQLAIFGVLCTALAHFGLHLDPKVIAELVGPIVFGVLGHGLADHGKEAAKVRAEALAEATKTASGNPS